MADFFVGLETVKLELPCGAWIEVKKELSFAEQQKVLGAGVGKVANTGQEFSMDFESMNVVKLDVWIDDWSLTDKDGKHVKKSKDAIAHLRPDVAQEMIDAIEKHQEGNEAEKKPRNSSKK